MVIVPDEKVRYVGKGSGDRLNDHRKKVGKRPYKRQVGLYENLEKLVQEGKDFYPRKIIDGLSEDEALVLERKKIEEYGFRNLFNGVCGPWFGKSSVHVLKRRGEMLKKAWARAKLEGRPMGIMGKKLGRDYFYADPEGRSKKISTSKKFIPVPLERRERISKTLTGRTYSFDPLKRISINLKISRALSGKSKTIPPEARIKAALSNTGKKRSKKVRDILSQLAKERPPKFKYHLTSPNGQEFDLTSQSIVEFCKQHKINANVPAKKFSRGIPWKGWVGVRESTFFQ